MMRDSDNKNHLRYIYTSHHYQHTFLFSGGHGVRDAGVFVLIQYALQGAELVSRKLEVTESPKHCHETPPLNIILKGLVWWINKEESEALISRPRS